MRITRKPSVKVKPVLFTSKTYKDGKHPILIRLTQGKALCYIGTGYSALVSNWNQDESSLWESRPRISAKQKEHSSDAQLKKLKQRYLDAESVANPKAINSEIQIAVGRILEIISLFDLKKKSYDLRTIQEAYNGKTITTNESFLEYAEKNVSGLFQQGRIATFKKNKSVIVKFRRFLKEEKQLRDLKFDGLTPELLTSFQCFLQNNYRNKGNTVHGNLKVIRTILYAAIKKDKIIDQSKNPFFNYTLPSYNNPQKEKLGRNEINAIMELILPEKSRIQDARNVFLFCFFNAGVRIGDLLRLKWENITPEGRLEYQMTKQGGTISTKLRPESLKIIREYQKKNSKEANYIFPFLPNGIEEERPAVVLNQISAKTALINKNLKAIASLAGIKKNLSTHIARHSFANLARKNGVGVYEISQALKHSSLQVTEAYLKTLPDETLDNALDKTFAGL